MKRSVTATALTFVALIGLSAAACSPGGMMNDGKMMNMSNDPKMMQQMMDQMMNDPKMMQQMSEQMMKNPEQCMRMADHMSKNPEACRNMMQAMASKMDPAASRQMMGHCDAMMKNAGSAAAAPSSASAAEASVAGVQEITVNVNGSGFSPDSLSVKKGQPVRISFKRDDQPTCADEVVFPALNIRKKLSANQTTIVELTPQKEGPLSFACGMNMMKGTLVVQ